MVSKVWDTMNDLEMVTSKICSAREIIDAAIDKIQEHQYDKAETMMSAAYEFLEYYLSEFDEKFKLAWQETVVKENKKLEEDCMPPWGHSDLEYLSQDWGTTVSSVRYTDEELDAMCDKAELDAQVEEIRKAGGYEWTPEVKKDVVTRWILPVQEAKDMDTDETEYFVSFPQDLLEAADLKEGDAVHWIDNNDGSYTIRKSTKPLGSDEC
jgi:hypothetical protein